MKECKHQRHPPVCSECKIEGLEKQVAELENTLSESLKVVKGFVVENNELSAYIERLRELPNKMNDLHLSPGQRSTLHEFFKLLNKSPNLNKIFCPGCDDELTIENAGGYRCFCDKCVSIFPDFPKEKGGYLIEGKYPDFKWTKNENL